MTDLKKQIDRINYISGYVVNETPSYRPVIDDSSFDSIPEGWNMKEADAPAPAPMPSPEPMPSPSSGSTAPAPAAPMPSPAAPSQAPSPAPSQAPSIAPELPAANVAPETTTPFSSDGNQQPVAQSSEDLQKEVMRFQLDAMKKMSQKIDQLENVINSLNAQQAELHGEVQKVKEPTDVEKFENRKQDSSPYYFNLNDMWNGNTFQARMDSFNSQGIVKTKDGYVADFDQLPKLSQYQVKDSFETI
jgi:hypothetical protein